MIRIERGAEVRPGVWAYCVPTLGLSGQSRQPLLDACRKIIALGGHTEEDAGVFRFMRTEPDIRCPVAKGAEVTVSETDAGRVTFARYRAFEGVR